MVARGALGHKKDRDSACESMPTDGVRIFPRRKVGEESALAPKKNRSPVCFDINSVSPFFDVPQSDAAKNLGISLTALKQVCRKLGLSRWPYVRPKKNKMRGVGTPSSTVAVSDCIDVGGDSPSEKEDDCMSSAGSTASCSSAETRRVTTGAGECLHSFTQNSERAQSVYDQQALEADMMVVAQQAMPLTVEPNDDVMEHDSGDDMSWLVPPSYSTAENLTQPTAQDLEKEAKWWQQYCENDPSRPHNRNTPLDGSLALSAYDSSSSKAALLALCFGA